MKTYLATTFSPSMLPSGGRARVEEVDEGTFRVQVQKAARAGELIPAVGHEVTAEILRHRIFRSRVRERSFLEFSPETLFARVNITLASGERLLAAIPQFRTPETREFSAEEVAQARFRYFLIEVL